MTHYVYVIGEEDGPYKVGFSNRPESRAKNVRAAERRQSNRVWHTVGCQSQIEARKVERLAHQRLASHRLPPKPGVKSGLDLIEWFDVPLAGAIEAVNDAKDALDAGERPGKFERFPFAMTLSVETDTKALLDEWRRQQADLPSRAEALRRLVRIALDAVKAGRK